MTWRQKIPQNISIPCSKSGSVCHDPLNCQIPSWEVTLSWRHNSLGYPTRAMTSFFCIQGRFVVDPFERSGLRRPERLERLRDWRVDSTALPSSLGQFNSTIFVVLWRPGLEPRLADCLPSTLPPYHRHNDPWVAVSFKTLKYFHWV